MEERSKWDWEPAVRRLGDQAPLPGCKRQEEWRISPDGESFAALTFLEEGGYAVRRNDKLWETTADKMTECRFSPDGRLTALAQIDGEWAVLADDAEVGEHADFYWGTLFSPSGTMSVCMQSDMQYGMTLEGEVWENLFHSATHFVMASGGPAATAAVIQTAPLGQADLEGFRKGVYTVAVNGEAWENTYLNAWNPCFDREGHRVACTVRVAPYEYTVSINGQRWDETFACAWEPVFEPQSGDVLAPVRKNGAWGLARNGSLFWKPAFAQCWSPKAKAVNGTHVWAIVAPSYGAFTVACNAAPWSCRFPSVTDLVLSGDGLNAAALGSENNAHFRIIVNGKVWNDVFDMAWPAVFSPDGTKAAAKVRRGDKYAVYVNGAAVAENLDDVWPPSFNPAGDTLLFCSLMDGGIHRHTVKLD